LSPAPPAPGFFLKPRDEERAMAPRPPNYQQQRGDRNRTKDAKKLEKLRRREEDAARRKADRVEAVPEAPAEDR
jgi:hypothetical protein